MIAEAVDTAFTLGWALAAWIVLTAAAGVLGLYAVAVGVWAALRPATEAVGRALAASRALRALRAEPDRYRPPRRPAWAAA
ncbi:hypothetical protein [Streptomyces sp. NBC_01530]|uniref:hypothetical protein n=1 Tax=Streptomyces sp. NBC_01530 TaxID=2903895 RepID=UPI00386880BF